MHSYDDLPLKWYISSVDNIKNIVFYAFKNMILMDIEKNSQRRKISFFLKKQKTIIRTIHGINREISLQNKTREISQTKTSTSLEVGHSQTGKTNLTSSYIPNIQIWNSKFINKKPLG